LKAPPFRPQPAASRGGFIIRPAQVVAVQESGCSEPKKGVGRPRAASSRTCAFVAIDDGLCIDFGDTIRRLA